MTENKKKIIAVRIDDKTLDYLNDFCKNHNLSKSQLIRRAIEKFIIFYQKGKDLHEYSKRLIFTKQGFKFMLNCMNESQLRKLAELEYNNYIDYFKKYSEVHMPALSAYTNYILSDRGFNFFDNLTTSFQEDYFFFAGIHELGKNFSIYIKFLISLMLKKQSYKLTESKLTENKIILKFQKRDNQ
ncbi:MAG: hypothetical protein ACTSQP_07080 [Promethearchaeota archaeon]